MHSSMTIQVNGGAKGTSSDSPQWSGEPGNDGKVYTATTCSKQSDCGSNEVCYNWDSGNWVGDHKCYTSNLAYGQTCAADSGVQLSARCASGLCRFSDKKCDHSGDAYVQNGSFEGNALATWTRYTSGGRNGYTVDTSYKNSGSQSIKVTNGGANKWIQLDAPARSTITISGFCKAVGTSTGHPRLEASVYSADGYLFAKKATFTGGTHDWEFSDYSFTAPIAVRGIILYALYRDDPAGGTAYFDDLAVTVKPNLVVNGGFEGNALATWTRYTSGGRNGYTVDTSYKNSGSQSIKVTNGGANKWIQLDAPARSTITISGFCKAVGTSSGLPRVEASVYYADGTKLWGRQARFRGGTHDWEFSEYSFTVPKAVRGIILYALYRDDKAGGTAYFDDLAVFVETP